MFHVGNLDHERVMASKRLFAEHVMPFLRPLNVDTASAAKNSKPVVETRHASGSTNGRLPLYGDFNYTITRDSPELVREFATSELLSRPMSKAILRSSPSREKFASSSQTS